MGQYNKRMTLQPHQERVVAERDELTVKTGKLAIFIGGPVFAGLPGEERDRLFRQLTSMYEYASVLNERIAAFQDVDLPQQLERFHNGVDNALAERISNLEKVIRLALLCCTCDTPLEVESNDDLLEVKCPNHPANSYQITTGN